MIIETCPKCGGELVKRTSKRGRTFYGCANYPSCDFTSWDKPVADRCPDCGHTMFQKGFGKRKRLYCAQCEPQPKKHNTKRKQS